MESFWTTICEKLNVPEQIKTMWWRERIEVQYSSPDRFYHNIDVMFLTHKLPHLPVDTIDPAVALASVFQYLKFSVNSDLSSENCALFREFASAAGLDEKQVRLLIRW